MVGITIATIAVLLTGGGGMDHYLTDLKGDVKKHVGDKERRSAILDASKELSSNLQALEKQINGHFQEFVKVHMDFLSLEQDYDAATAQLVADQKSASEQILNARETMREKMTREEWNAVFQSSENNN